MTNSSSGLSEKDQIYVAEFLRTGSMVAAAKAMGLDEKRARGQGNRIMKKPAVKAAVQAAQAKSTEAAAYGCNEAMREAEEAIEFAKKTKNANAYVKAVELRSKLKGLLVEKYDVRQSGFNITIQGFGMAGKPALDAGPIMPIIDVTPQLPAPTNRVEPAADPEWGELFD